MHLVAIGEVRGNLDDALAPLARELGTTAYELRLLFNAGLPAVVLATNDEAVARAAVAAIARQGHTPVHLDRRAVASSAQMTLLRDFELTPSEIVPQSGGAARLPYEEIAAVLRATHRTTAEKTETETSRQLRPVMAVASGGLILTKKTTRTVTSRNASIESVAYLFRRDRTTPWLLKERSAQYGGLGERLRPTSFENFSTTLRLIRERAPAALYDERLMNSRPIRGVAEGVQATDLYAHLLAGYLLR